jgi:transcriptional regulator with XRE-family HTH domain
VYDDYGGGYMKEINLASVLAERRREKGITQDELADFAGVSKSSVSKWETGHSFPDITILPVLASYFDISVDELICYKPQLSKEEIGRVYKRMADRFAKDSFEDVLEECESLTKKYYSCYPFLLEIAGLYINHAAMADGRENQMNIYALASKICKRILDNSKEGRVIAQAQTLQAICYTIQGKAKEVLELLGDEVELRMMPGIQIAHAHLMLGDSAKADEAMQADLYQSVMGAFGTTLTYMQKNITDFDFASEAFRRAEGICELFNMKALNANNMALLYAAGAYMNVLAGKNQDALGMLEKYVDVCCDNFFPYKIHGDEFFNQLEDWLEKRSSFMPRSESVVKESMLKDVLMSQTFEGLRAYPEFERLADRLKALIGGE